MRFPFCGVRRKFDLIKADLRSGVMVDSRVRFMFGFVNVAKITTKTARIVVFGGLISCFPGLTPAVGKLLLIFFGLFNGLTNFVFDFGAGA